MLPAFQTTVVRASVRTTAGRGNYDPSRNQRFRISLGLLLISAVFVVAGCGGPQLPELMPVKGKVLVDDAPVTSGQVSFTPTNIDNTKPVPASAGQIDSSGNYEIFTGGKSGAPKGKYKVTVSPAMVPMEGAMGPPKTPYDEKFRDLNKTPLQFDVPKADGYDLKLTK